MTATVELYHNGKAEIELVTLEGSLGPWEFPHFPVDDFNDAGLNIIGPWLNRRGLAYKSWITTGLRQETAVVYVYDGPEVDKRVRERRKGA